MRRDKPKFIAVSTPDRRIARIAESRGGLGDDVEDRLKVRRRAGDDAKNLIGGGLLFQ